MSTFIPEKTRLPSCGHECLVRSRAHHQQIPGPSDLQTCVHSCLQARSPCLSYAQHPAHLGGCGIVHPSLFGCALTKVLSQQCSSLSLSTGIGPLVARTCGWMQQRLRLSGQRWGSSSNNRSAATRFVCWVEENQLGRLQGSVSKTASALMEQHHTNSLQWGWEQNQRVAVFAFVAQCGADAGPIASSWCK